MKKLYIWDFHGTLEKNNENAVLEISNKVLEIFGYEKRFAEEYINKLYGRKWWEYFKFILPSEAHEKHLELQEACFNFQNSSDIIKKYISPADYAHYVLEEIVKAGHSQILISNTNPESLNVFIEAVNMGKYFSAKNSFAADTHRDNKTKNNVLENFLKENEFNEIIIIGDSPSDMELKDFISAITNTKTIKTYFYMHKGRKIRECEADYYINDLREILKEI